MSDDRSAQSEREAILKLLEPLFAQAAAEDKWFKVANTPDGALIVFTPEELRTLHKMNQMIFGPAFWVLIEPPFRRQP
jgi:hypothetical protein